jgi:ubiquinone biosynthesis monooxygenase Coq7
MESRLPVQVQAPSAPQVGRQFGPLDRFLVQADRGLKTLLAPAAPSRPYPAGDIAETVTSPTDKRQVAALMRVNHAGEVAAQALYQGHAVTAGSEDTRASMEEASREEADHLAWCETRVTELGGRTSLLAPIWYAGSFAIGAIAGFAGDQYSLGFVAETERQVVAHLDSHLKALPHDDLRTRAILKQMSADEERHGKQALAAGGIELPSFVKRAMRSIAHVMTRTAYRL